jgi:hypothetical protein
MLLPGANWSKIIACKKTTHIQPLLIHHLAPLPRVPISMKSDFPPNVADSGSDFRCDFLGGLYCTLLLPLLADEFVPLVVVIVDVVNASLLSPISLVSSCLKRPLFVRSFENVNDLDDDMLDLSSCDANIPFSMMRNLPTWSVPCGLSRILLLLPTVCRFPTGEISLLPPPPPPPDWELCTMPGFPTYHTTLTFQKLLHL